MAFRPYIKNANGSLTDLPLEAEQSVKLKTPRTINLSGVTATGASFDGTGNATIEVTSIPANKISGLSSVATSGSYEDLEDKPDIPEKTSDLTNDSGFITANSDITGNAASASKLGSSTVGSSTKPIYLSNGSPTQASTYAGGTKVTLNGSDKGASTASLYAPTNAGSEGNLLKSNGSGSPGWVSSESYLNNPKTVSMAQNLVVNINGSQFGGNNSQYSFNVVTIQTGYTTKQFQYQGSPVTSLDTIKSYLKHMTGCTTVPVYNQTAPQACFIICGVDNTVWKLQYDQANYLIAYKVDNFPLAFKSDINDAKKSATYTFVVDSNQALSDWINNVSGNDYTSVLIKKGTWEYSCPTTSDYYTPRINLTATGTKVVVGEPGSIINLLTCYGACIGYTAKPTTDLYKYYMNNVKILSVAGNGGSKGFIYCLNLTGCEIITGSRVHDPFYYCDHLRSCKVDSYLSNGVIGFNNCNYLDDCEANINDGCGSNVGYAFYYCKYITNSKAYIIQYKSGGGKNVASNYAFYYCKCLVNCLGDAVLDNTTSTSVTASGFDHCYDVVNCKGSGYDKSSSTSITKGYGFSYCYGVRNCSKSDTTSKSSTFYGSYAGHSSTYDYMCADTPAGGFNDVT